MHRVLVEKPEGKKNSKGIGIDKRII